MINRSKSWNVYEKLNRLKVNEKECISPSLQLGQQQIILLGLVSDAQRYELLVK